MKWLLVVMLSNGSNVSLDTYDSNQACEAKAFPMRIEMKVRESKLLQCMGSSLYTPNGLRVPADPKKEFECYAEVNRTVPKDERTNAICISKG